MCVIQSDSGALSLSEAWGLAFVISTPSSLFFTNDDNSELYNQNATSMRNTWTAS